MDNTNGLKVFATRALSLSHWPTSERQPSVIVAAKSRAAAVRAFQQVISSMTDSHLKNYGTVTGNRVQIEAAMSEPGTVFVSTAPYSSAPGDYVPMRPEAGAVTG